MKIISVIKNGRRVDIPQDEFQKILEKAEKEVKEMKEQKDEI